MDPNAFVTFDQLKSFTGQIAAVLAIGQTIWAAWPGLSTYRLRLAVVLSAVCLNAIVGALDATIVNAWAWRDFGMIALMAPVNGLVVALAAMKVAEFLKSASRPRPQ